MLSSELSLTSEHHVRSHEPDAKWQKHHIVLSSRGFSHRCHHLAALLWSRWFSSSVRSKHKTQSCVTICFCSWCCCSLDTDPPKRFGWSPPWKDSLQVVAVTVLLPSWLTSCAPSGLISIPKRIAVLQNTVCIQQAHRPAIHYSFLV